MIIEKIHPHILVIYLQSLSLHPIKNELLNSERYEKGNSSKRISISRF
jgi:hypothetical protein